MAGADATHNSWNLVVSVNSADYQSTAMAGWDAPRQANGSLPVRPHSRLVSGSDLIDKGANVGLPCTCKTPDLSAFEL